MKNKRVFESYTIFFTNSYHLQPFVLFSEATLLVWRVFWVLLSPMQSIVSSVKAFQKAKLRWWTGFQNVSLLNYWFLIIDLNLLYHVKKEIFLKKKTTFLKTWTLNTGKMRHAIILRKFWVLLESNRRTILLLIKLIKNNLIFF